MSYGLIFYRINLFTIQRLQTKLALQLLLTARGTLAPCNKGRRAFISIFIYIVSRSWEKLEVNSLYPPGKYRGYAINSIGEWSILPFIGYFKHDRVISFSLSNWYVKVKFYTTSCLKYPIKDKILQSHEFNLLFFKNINFYIGYKKLTSNFFGRVTDHRQTDKQINIWLLYRINKLIN